MGIARIQKSILSAVLVFWSTWGHATTQPGTWGLGVGIGGLSGISTYYHASKTNFFQGLFAIAQSGERFALTTDYARVHPHAIEELPALRPYYGLGMILEKYPRGFLIDRNRVRNDMYVGARIPIGIQAMIPSTPLQFVLEIVPGSFLIPSTFVFIDVMVAVRYLF